MIIIDSEVIGAAVYGSVSRGESTPSSDIDLLIIVADGVDHEADFWERQVDDLERSGWTWTGNRLQVATVTRGGLASMIATGDSIVGEWERDAHTIAGRDVPTMIRELRKGVGI